MARIEHPFQTALPVLCADLFAYLTELRKTADVPDADVLRARFLELLNGLDAGGARASQPAEDVAAAKFALVAFLDEIVLNSRWTARAAWADRPLQLELFNEAAAGEEFFARIEGLRGDAKRREVLEVYFLCLALGFRGKHGDLAGMGKLTVLTENVGGDLKRMRGAATDKAAPSAVAPASLPQLMQTMPAWTIAVASATVVLLVFAVLTWLLNGHASSVLDAIQGQH